jgi:hypothetical protein
VQERRISYVLKTGANWAGDQTVPPVGRCPQGRPPGDFCGPNLKTISPTTTEATAGLRRTGPQILIVGRF